MLYFFHLSVLLSIQIQMQFLLTDPRHSVSTLSTSLVRAVPPHNPGGRLSPRTYVSATVTLEGSGQALCTGGREAGRARLEKLGRRRKPRSVRARRGPSPHTCPVPPNPDHTEGRDGVPRGQAGCFSQEGRVIREEGKNEKVEGRGESKGRGLRAPSLKAYPCQPAGPTCTA